MKKKLCVLVAMMWILLSGFAPLGGYWIDLNTTQLGNIRMYLNSTYQSGYFSLDEGVPVNMTTSTISGYTIDSSGARRYQIQAYPYGERWQYRAYNTPGASWSELTVTGYEADTTTIDLMGVDLAPAVEYNYIMIFLVGALIVLVFIRR